MDVGGDEFVEPEGEPGFLFGYHLLGFDGVDPVAVGVRYPFDFFGRFGGGGGGVEDGEGDGGERGGGVAGGVQHGLVGLAVVDVVVGFYFEVADFEKQEGDQEEQGELQESQVRGGWERKEVEEDKEQDERGVEFALLEGEGQGGEQK